MLTQVAILLLQTKRNKFILYHHFQLKGKKEKQNRLNSTFQLRISSHPTLLLLFSVAPHYLTPILLVMAFVGLH